MPRNTTLNLPDDLVRRARAYAADKGVTLTSIVRSHLEAVTAVSGPSAHDDVLTAFSEGRIGKEQAVRDLGLRDYAELLPLLGQAGLPLPLLPAHVLRDQAALFAEVWRRP